MNIKQLEIEIEWLKHEIVKLKADLRSKPRKQKQIDNYEYQIRHTELTITLH